MTARLTRWVEAFRVLSVLTVPVMANAAAEPPRTVYDMPLESLLRVTVASPLESGPEDTAASVSVLEPADWQGRGARSLDEALEQIPSVTTYASLDSARMISVRGYANELSVRGLATLLDGVPLNNFSYATALYDLPFVPLGLLQRVEMIRGPGSTLYGSDAFHGVLSLSTRADDAAKLRAMGSGGSFGDGGVGVTAHQGGEPVDIQGGGMVTRHGDRALTYGFHDPVSGASASGQRADSLDDRAGVLNLSGGGEGRDGGRWEFGLYGDDFRGRGFPGVGDQFYPPIAAHFPLKSLSLAGSHDLAGQDSHFAMARAGYARELSDNWDLRLQTYHWQAAQTWDFDFSQMPLSLQTASGQTVPCRTSLHQSGALPTYCPHLVHQGTEDSRDGAQLSLVWRPESATQWVFGAGQDRMRVDDAFVRRIGLDGTPYLDILTPFNQVGRRIGFVWFHARTDWADGRLSAIYGLRHDDYSDAGAANSPRLGLIWRANRDWTGKLVYNHAFRAPSAAERYGGGPGSQQLENPDIRPETIDTWEVIGEYRRGDVEGGLTLFHTRWDNGIVLNPVSGTVSQYQNTGLNESWGAELTQSRPVGSWRLDGNLSWAHSRNLVSAVDYSAFPSVIANLSLSRVFAGIWSLQINERAQLDRTETDALAGKLPKDAPDAWRTDLHVERDDGAWRTWLDIRNLFDRRDIEPALFNAEGGIPQEGISARLGLERRW